VFADCLNYVFYSCCTERVGETMEFVTLENSSLTEEDFLLTEIKQEALDEV